MVSGGLLDEIKQGVKLKKVVTVEKTSLNYNKSIKKDDSSNNITTSSSESSTKEVKGDIFAEMRKVQLRKLNK